YACFGITDHVRIVGRFQVFSVKHSGDRKDFLMLRSMRQGATLCALVFTVATLRPWPVNAQASPQVQPASHVQNAATPNATTGFTPTQIRRAYGFDQVPNQGSGQIIAIVDSFDHPNIEQDLSVFNETFGVP